MPTRTYTLIEAKTITTASSGFSFLAIPQTYTDLRLLISSVNGGSIYVYPNNDNTANKSRTNLYVNSATPNGSSGGASGNTGIYVDGGSVSNYPGIVTLDLFSYSQTDKFKTLSWRWANGSSSETTNGFWVANYNTNTAISSLYFYPETTYTFAVGSAFRLYGIKREP